MQARVACLSPFDEGTVRAMFLGRHKVDVVLLPAPPAQPEVATAWADADLTCVRLAHFASVGRRAKRHLAHGARSQARGPPKSRPGLATTGSASIPSMA